MSTPAAPGKRVPGYATRGTPLNSTRRAQATWPPGTKSGIEFRLCSRPGQLSVSNTSLSALESQLQLPGFMNAMAAYMKKLKLQSQSAGQALNETLYSNCPENLQSLCVSQATSVSLTSASFKADNTYKKPLIQCTSNWRGKGARSDFLFRQNEVVGPRKANNAFRGKAVCIVLCLFQWETSPRVGKHKLHYLTLLDIMLPLKPNASH